MAHLLPVDELQHRETKGRHLGDRPRVGVILRSSTWTGGRNYLRNLLTAVNNLPAPAIEPVLFIGKQDEKVLAGFPPVEVVRTAIFDRKTPAWVLRQITLRTLPGDPALHRLLLRHRIDVLSHSGSLGEGSPIASIGWIPDFQHVHLPQFFDEKERALRNRDSIDLCKRSDKVIVSSECARADLMSFAPEYVDKATVLRFVASPVPASEATSLPELQKKYAFDGPYLLLPNQFWAHKNHRVVIAALQMLKKQNKRVLVLATGATDDYRHPDFFASFMKYAEDSGVLDVFHVLGAIPFHDLAGLMLHAAAFINPSHFEGWSTTVEESKSLGKRMLLSDIPVHREQAPALGEYFPPNDPEALAAALWSAWQGFDPMKDLQMQEQARSGFPARQRSFAEAYQQIVLSAVRKKH